MADVDPRPRERGKLEKKPDDIDAFDGKLGQVDEAAKATNSISDANQGTVPTKHGDTSSRVGQTLGRYEIRQQLGQGGMGAVYLARDTQLDRDVALKIPHFTFDDDGGDVLDRFHREAKAAATLRHSHICPTYDVGEIDGVHYITMAYIQGKPLSKLVRRGNPVQAKQVAQIILQLADALQEAHCHGVVHRDLKPANVMMTKGLQPVIMDFGLARRSRLDADESQLTTSGMILGTPSYMPPEQVAGDISAIGPHSDIYSLGVVMYELLTGELPFEGPVGLVLGQIMTVEPKPPREVHGKADPRLEAICQKAMSKQEEDRYASMAELASELRSYLGQGASVTVGNETTEGTKHTERETTKEQAVMFGVGVGADVRATTEVVEPDEAVARVPVASSVPRPSTFGSVGRRWWNSTTAYVTAGLGGLALLCGIVFKVLDRDGNPVAQVIVPEGGQVEVEELESDTGTTNDHDSSGIEQRGGSSPVSAAAPVDASENIDRIGPSEAENPLALMPWQRLPSGEVWTMITKGHAGNVHAVAFSPDETRFVSGGVDGVLRFWSLHEGELLNAVPLANEIRAIDWSPDGQVLAVTDGRDIRLVNSDTGQTIDLLQDHVADVWDLKFSPDGRTLASCDGGSYLFLWDVASQSPEHRQLEGCLKVHWLSSDEMVVARPSAGSLDVFQVGSGAHQKIADYDWNVVLAISPDAKRIATSWVNHAANHSVVTAYWLSGEQINEVELTSESPWIVRAINWDTTDNFSLDIVSSSGGGSRLEKWNLVAPEQRVFQSLAPVANNGFHSISGGCSVVTHDAGTMSVVNRNAGSRLILQSRVNGDHWPVWRSQDRLLCVSGGALTLLVNTATGQLSTRARYRLPALAGPGELITSYTSNPMLTTWDPSTNTSSQSFNSGDWGYPMAWSTDGKKLLTIRDGRHLRIYDVDNREVLVEVDFHAYAADLLPYNVVQWAPNDEWIALGNNGGTVVFWDTRTPGIQLQVGADPIVGLSWQGHSHLLVAHRNRTDGVKTVDVAKQQLVSQEALPVDSHATSFSSDGRNLALVNRHLARITIYDRERRRITSIIQLLRGHRMAIFKPRGTLLPSRGAEQHLACVVQSDATFKVVSPTEFRSRYDVSNAVSKVSLFAEEAASGD